MAGHYLAADCQSHAASFVLASPVQPLERPENPVQVFLVEPDPVIPNHDVAPVRILLSAIQRDLRRHPRFSELERVSDQVLQKLPHLQVVRHDAGHRLELESGVLLGDSRLQVHRYFE